MIQIINQKTIDELTQKHGPKFEEFLRLNSINIESVYRGWCFKNWLAECFAEMEKDNSIVSDIYINVITFSKFRAWPDDSWEPITIREILQTGHYGNLWTARIMIDKTYPNDVYTLVTEKGNRKEFPLPDFLKS
jgi:hypothetical protein